MDFITKKNAIVVVVAIVVAVLVLLFFLFTIGAKTIRKQSDFFRNSRGKHGGC